jgi:hypothetical protein
MRRCLSNEQPFGRQGRSRVRGGPETQPVGEAGPFDAELLSDARPFAQFDDDRSAGASRRKHLGSVRNEELMTSASRLPSLAPAMEKRSRKRSIFLD